MKDFDYVKINTVNPLYLIINKADSSNEESNGNEYLVFASADKNKDVLEKHTKPWDETKHHVKTINGSKCSESGQYGKDYMNMKFSSDDNLPLNKLLKLRNLTIIVRSVFTEESKYYPQNLSYECYEL